MSSTEFIKEILVNTIGTKKLVIGYDHKFGKNREGTFEHLVANASEYGFEVEEISKKEVEDVTVSSTKIRSALFAGEVKEAARLLGRPYMIRGRVVKGERIGHAIGFPTANIEMDFKHKLVPAEGAYAVKVNYHDEQHNGMLNIGYRPTIDGKTRTIEVHLFNFDSDLYGEELSIAFIEHLRSERKFNDIEELKEQLIKDQQQALKLLNE